jgi:hypothetical protein
VKFDFAQRNSERRIRAREYLYFSVLSTNQEVFIGIASLSPRQMNNFRKSFQRLQLLCFSLIPICELLVVIIVEYPKKCSLGIRSYSYDFILVFSIVLKYATAEITSTIDRAFALNFEV